LVKDIEKLVGKRKRSRFVEDAVREKLNREKLLSALEETAGIISAAEYPDWATTEKAAAWVRESRHEDMKRLEKLSSHD
jgi:metal-responsive CopG/Arc/MetJ family transcriptional regulator